MTWTKAVGNYFDQSQWTKTIKLANQLQVQAAAVKRRRTRVSRTQVCLVFERFVSHVGCK